MTTTQHRRNATHCRSCGARVIWARHTGTGKLSPIDADPTPHGTVVLDVHRAHPAWWIQTAADDPAGDRHTNHFATCPEAPEWRQRTRDKENHR